MASLQGSLQRHNKSRLSGSSFAIAVRPQLVRKNHMSQVRLRSVIATLALACVGMSALAADSHDPEALAIWREAVDSHSTDYELLHECTVTGEMRVTFLAT